jgi:hypothetical protein
MTDSNVSEKLVEGITNIIRKTIIFEKTERMKTLFIGLAISSSVFGLFTIYNSYQVNIMNEKQNDIDEKLTSIENVIIVNEHMPKLYYKIFTESYDVFYKMSRFQIYTEKKVDILNEKIDKLIALLDDKKVEKDK